MLRSNMRSPARAALIGVLATSPFLFLSTQAQATAFAYSALEVENASINTGDFGGFDSFEFTSFPLSVQLDGTSQASSGTEVSTVSGGTTNQSQLTIGDTPFATENEYFGANAPGFESQEDFAVADSHQSNTLLGDGTGNFGTQAGAQAGFNGANTGNADTGTNNSLSWVFNVDSSELVGGSLDLDLNFDTTRVFFASTSDPGDSARATLGLSVELFNESGEIVDSETIYNLVTNLQTSPNEFGSETAISEAQTAELTILEAGDYTLNILFDSSAQVRTVDASVPEPGALGILGLGLVAMGVVSRKRKSASA